MTGYIHSIETFGTVDGPGIRYVVFLQGCPLRCLYCHNPDTWDLKKGKERSIKDILDEYETYRPFLKDGGLTVTGGEPLMQMDFVIELFKEAKKRDIHTCLDTSGITFSTAPTKLNKFNELIKYTNLVMLDIKNIDNEEHKKLTKHPNLAVLDFARYLAKNDIPIWVRHVVIPGYTYKQELLEKLGFFLADIKTLKALDVLPYHTMGVDKYEKLGKKYALEGVEALDKEHAIIAKQHIINGIKKRLKEKKAIKEKTF